MDACFRGFRSYVEADNISNLRGNCRVLLEEAEKNIPLSTVGVGEALIKRSDDCLVVSRSCMQFVTYIQVKFSYNFNYDKLESNLIRLINAVRKLGKEFSSVKVEIMGYLGKSDYKLRWYGISSEKAMDTVLEAIECDNDFIGIKDIYTIIVDYEGASYAPLDETESKVSLY